MTTRTDLSPRQHPWAGPTPEEARWQEPAGRPWEQRGYLWLRRWRDLLMAPVVLPLARLGVAPWLVSLAGVALTASLFLTVPASPRLALAAFVAALACDAVDGALARRLDRDGPRGKLFDLLCDSATFATVLLALMSAGQVSPVRGAYAAYVTLLLLFVAVCFHSTRQPCSGSDEAVLGEKGLDESGLDEAGSGEAGAKVAAVGGVPPGNTVAGDASTGGAVRQRVEAWGLRPRGGFYAHLPKVPVYIAFVLWLVGGPQWLDPSVLLANVLATLFVLPLLGRLLGPASAAV